MAVQVIPVDRLRTEMFFVGDKRSVVAVYYVKGIGGSNLVVDGKMVAAVDHGTVSELATRHRRFWFMAYGETYVVSSDPNFRGFSLEKEMQGLSGYGLRMLRNGATAAEYLLPGVEYIPQD